MRPVVRRFLATALVVAAVALLVRSTLEIEAVPWLALAVWVVLATFTEIAPVAMPGGGTITITSLLDYAGIVVFGPALTAWVDIFSTIVARTLSVPAGGAARPGHVLQPALHVFTTLLAGLAFQALGGSTGALEFPRDTAAVAAMGGTYFALRVIGGSLAVELATGRPLLAVAGANLAWNLLHLVVFVPFGCLVALVHLHLSLPGTLLIMIPILLARHSFKLYAETRQDFRDFVDTLTRVIEEVDPYTRHHSHRVAHYARQIGQEMQRPDRELEAIAMAALLHDLGKVSFHTQEAVESPGKLTRRERERMRHHPIVGAEIVSRVRMLRTAATFVRSHHERLDGSGYPVGLRGAEIPLGARILMVADALDAMTSDRPYRRAMRLEEAMEELRKQAGRQLDAEVIAAVERLHARGELRVLYDTQATDASDGAAAAAGGTR